MMRDFIQAANLPASLNSIVGRFLLKFYAFAQIQNMIRRIFLFLCGFLLMASSTSLAPAQKSSRVSIVGCYSDLDSSSGDVIGVGVVKITKKKGKYAGTFAELQNERGEAWEETPLENLVVNESSKTITFDIKFHRVKNINTGYLETVRGVTGKITKFGVKMNWRGMQAEYGANPFMKRDKDCY